VQFLLNAMECEIQPPLAKAYAQGVIRSYNNGLRKPRNSTAHRASLPDRTSAAAAKCNSGPAFSSTTRVWSIRGLS